MTFNYQYVVLVLIGTIALLCAQLSISILFLTTEEINENRSKNEAFLLSTPRKWIYMLLICLCGLHIIIYLFLYVLLGQLPSCGCLLYRKERFPVPTAATRDTCTLPLSVCFFVARSAEVINKVQRASKTDREREGGTRAVTTNYGTVKVSDEAHLSGSLIERGRPT